MSIKKEIVHRDGTDYGPYQPLVVCELLHKGKLLHQDHARLTNGAEWEKLGNSLA